MLDNQIKDTVCYIECGQSVGSGCLIANNIILTARHCIIEAIQKKELIRISFREIGNDSHYIAEILDENADFDVALLKINDELEVHPLKCNPLKLREGADWRSFGFPKVKRTIGHKISGQIAQVLTTPISRVDLDLTIAPSNILSEYNGLSGAPIIVDGLNVGMICLKVDKTLGGISFFSLKDYLSIHNIELFKSENYVTNIELAKRETFQNIFEEKILNSGGKYVLLEGAHGIGKTTFCNEFTASDKKIYKLGTYNLSGNGQGINPIVKAQPDIFFDWLSVLMSDLITGKPANKESYSYKEIVDQTNSLIRIFSDYCSAKNTYGLIFIDALNEVEVLDTSTLAKFMGIFSKKLPNNIIIVLTSINYNLIAKYLQSYVLAENIISLSKLNEEECYFYYSKNTLQEKLNPSLFPKIYEISQGHPLYLKYMVDYINDSDEGNLDNFPVFTGKIEEYYESIWISVVQDENAIILLGIIARLRWGIDKRNLLLILHTQEQNIFISTMSRINHLLENSEEIKLYHNSFTDFIIEKTKDNDEIIHRRISSFCENNLKINYCQLNIIYHLLKLDETNKFKAITLCSQDWVDSCVTIGVEPDILIDDIEQTLYSAVNLKKSIEVVRLLLLLQRVIFRYNVLFTQSASLIGNALIALNKPKEALKHIIRFETLISSPSETLDIAINLNNSDFQEDGRKLIKTLIHTLRDNYYADNSEITLNEYIDFHSLILKNYSYLQFIDSDKRYKVIEEILRMVVHTLKDTIGEDDIYVLEQYTARIQSILFAMTLYFFDSYMSLEKFKELYPDDKLPPALFMTIILGLLEYEKLIAEFGATYEYTSFDTIFSDLSILLEREKDIQERVEPIFIHILILLNAPKKLILLFSEKCLPLRMTALNFIQENGVDIDFGSIHNFMAEQQVISYLDSNLVYPKIQEMTSHNWIKSFKDLIYAVAWCDGKARQSKNNNDEVLRNQVLEFFKNIIFNFLKFTLEGRSKLIYSYAVPENFFPFIWEHITKIFIDCYPDYLVDFIKIFDERFSFQFGLYTEGFRKTLELTIKILIDSCIKMENSELEDNIFLILERWKNYLIEGIENRYELIPELLKIIPFFTKLNAIEKAENLYSHVLSVSMGPSWYKEDQFGLMTSLFQSIPKSDELNIDISQIAAYLEKASGEMTFQRFIRHEKSAFLGELFNKNLYKQGIEYFKRQSCGSISELLEDVQRGTIDRISSIKGMRFPGGGIDEQQSIIRIVRNCGGIDWKLKWSLLEIYQCGDKRYLEDYAHEYAHIINSQYSNDNFPLLLQSIKRVTFGEVSYDVRKEFLEAFFSKLNTDVLRSFLQLDEFKSFYEFEVPVSSSTDEESVENHDDQSRNTLFLPGLFGHESSITQAKKMINEANKKLSRGNQDLARRDAVSALEIIQQGEWPIWSGNLSSYTKQAVSIITSVGNDAESIIESYETLIKSEKYTDKWKIAENLIELITDKLSLEERNLLVNHIFEHIKLMVGETEHESKMYSFLNLRTDYSPEVEIFEFVIWMIDHPHWLRRQQAGHLILWLLNEDSRYFDKAVQIAFSNQIGYCGDVVAGVIDNMSQADNVEIARKIAENLDLNDVINNLEHVSRLAILYRILKRAAKNTQDFDRFISTIEKKFNLGIIELDISNNIEIIPEWLESFSYKISQLNELGLFNAEILSYLEEKLLNLYHPLSINEALQLEKLIATGSRENDKLPLNRWEGRVYFALNQVLLGYVSQSNFQKVESILRVYNPYAPEKKLKYFFNSRGAEILQAVQQKIPDYTQVIGNNEDYYLHYCEGIRSQYEEGEHISGSFIEILAILLPNSLSIERVIKSAYKASFRSIDYIGSITSNLGVTCTYVTPSYSFFGSFTPAIPSKSFIEMTNLQENNFSQVVWRNGRSYEFDNKGQPENEGCYLSIKKTALQLPTNTQMIWIIRINGKLHAIVDSNNQRIN